MFSFNSLLPVLLFSIAEVLIYLAVIGMVLRQSDGQKSATYLTGLYVFIAFIIQSGQLAWQANFLPSFNAFTLEQIHWYSSLSLSFLLILIFYAFLKKEKNEIWLSIGVFFVAVILLLSFDVFRIPNVLWTNGVWMIPRERLGFGVVALGWISFTLGSLITFRRAYKNTRQPLHRNRLLYWLPVFALLMSADAFFINNFPNWGAVFRLLGTWLLGYVVVTHYLPDLQQFTRSALVYISTTLFASIFYMLVFSLAQQIFPVAVKTNPLFIGTFVALLLASIFRPLLKFIERIVDHWMHIDTVNVSQTINEYSQSISNILDMERLADVTVSIIMEIMGIQRGFLFLVDKEKKKDGTYYALRPVRNAGERPINVIWLNEEGPIAKHLTVEQRPLLQFDLDLLPLFKYSRPEERNWLTQLNAEVYVPIFSKREWIGIFALGGKISGNRYSKENLLTLSALAGQTAVALENARLVENLIDLNSKVRDAYRDLENTKSDLEKIDRTKSDFISIASHELRTPLTVMRGYTEMLLENTSLDKTVLKMLKSIHSGTMRLHEIMDSLFDIAQIDARTLELELEPIDVGRLIYEVSIGVNQVAKDREQSIFINLPPLPGIQADPDTLRKVFYHLISNAIKFTPNKGRIIIRGKSHPLSSKALPDGGVEIVVSDTGIGIDANFREIIFTKFYQPSEQLGNHSTGKSKFKGSGAGLGLALSRGIVEAHGGKIWAESLGYDEIKLSGSHFHVILPLRKKLEGSTLPISEAIKLTI